MFCKPNIYRSLEALERRRAQIKENEKRLKRREKKIRRLRRKWRNDMHIRLQETIMDISKMNMNQVGRQIRAIQRLREIGQIGRNKVIRNMRDQLHQWNDICEEREYFNKVLGLLRERLNILSAICIKNKQAITWQAIKVQNLLKLAKDNKLVGKYKLKKFTKKKANTTNKKVKKTINKGTKDAKCKAARKVGDKAKNVMAQVIGECNEAGLAIGENNIPDKVKEYIRMTKLAYRGKEKRAASCNNIVCVMPTIQEVPELEQSETFYKVAFVQDLRETQKINEQIKNEDKLKGNGFKKIAQAQPQETIMENRVKAESEDSISFRPCITTTKAAYLSAGKSIESLVIEEKLSDEEQLYKNDSKVEEAYGTMVLQQTPTVKAATEIKPSGMQIQEEMKDYACEKCGKDAVTHSDHKLIENEECAVELGDSLQTNEAYETAFLTGNIQERQQIILEAKEKQYGEILKKGQAQLCLELRDNVELAPCELQNYKEDFEQQSLKREKEIPTQWKENNTDIRVCPTELEENHSQVIKNIWNMSVDQLQTELAMIVNGCQRETGGSASTIEMKRKRSHCLLEDKLPDCEESFSYKSESNARETQNKARTNPPILEEKQYEDYESRLQINEKRLRQIWGDIEQRKQKLEELEKVSREKLISYQQGRYREFENHYNEEYHRSDTSKESELTCVLKEAIRRADERAAVQKQEATQKMMLVNENNMEIPIRQQIDAASASKIRDNDELLRNMANMKQLADKDLLAQTEYHLACAEQLAELINESLRKQEACLKQTEYLHRKMEMETLAKERALAEEKWKSKMKMRRINAAALNLAVSAGISLEECKTLYNLEMFLE